jgi:hypothetical protein
LLVKVFPPAVLTMSAEKSAAMAASAEKTVITAAQRTNNRDLIFIPDPPVYFSVLYRRA